MTNTKYSISNTKSDQETVEKVILGEKYIRQEKCWCKCFRRRRRGVYLGLEAPRASSSWEENRGFCLGRGQKLGES